MEMASRFGFEDEVVMLQVVGNWNSWWVLRGWRRLIGELVGFRELMLCVDKERRQGLVSMR